MSTQRVQFSPAGAIMALAAIGLVTLLVHEFLASNTLRSAPIESVALIAPLAPPPPAPPPEVQKPEEKQVVSTQALDTGDWTPGEPAATPGPGSGSGAAPTDGALGVDEAGASGTDSFGLAGKPGGRELLLTGAGGGGGNPNGRYLQFASQIQAYIKDQLNQVASLTQDCYTVNVAVWVAATGSIDDVRIRKSTGDRILDSEIRSALLQLAPMDPAPPSDMPWPVILQMVAHRADCKPESASTAPRSSY